MTALGATFLTRDATLQPLLATLLLATIATSALTRRRRRNLIPLIVTVIGAALIYLPLYGFPEIGRHDTMPGHTHHGGGPLVWLGLALLVGAQIADLWPRHRTLPPDSQ